MKTIALLGLLGLSLTCTAYADSSHWTGTYVESFNAGKKTKSATLELGIESNDQTVTFSEPRELTNLSEEVPFKLQGASLLLLNHRIGTYSSAGCKLTLTDDVEGFVDEFEFTIIDGETATFKHHLVDYSGDTVDGSAMLTRMH